MKYLLVVFILLTTLEVQLFAQQMDAQSTVIKLFVSTDQGEWDAVQDCFDEQVLLDYTSMVGGEPTKLAPKQIVDSWKSVLPGFEHTHHQLGNFITQESNKEAKIFCYGTATHYLDHDQGNVWIVVGSYDFHLVERDDLWKIDKMKFNFKYQEGNKELPEAAKSRLSNKH